jgi:hypothetical protein
MICRNDQLKKKCMCVKKKLFPRKRFLLHQRSDKVLIAFFSKFNENIFLKK